MAPRAEEDADVLLVDLDEPCPCAFTDGPTASRAAAAASSPVQADHHWKRRLAEAVVLALLAPVVLGDLLVPTTTTAPAASAPQAPGPWADQETAERSAVAHVRSASPLAVVVPADAHRGSAPLPVMLTERGARYVVVLSCQRQTHLDVGLAGQEPTSLTCSPDGPVYRFTGRGRLAQVVVDVPDDVVWAAEVVTA